MTPRPAPRSTRSTARGASRWRAAATSMRSASGCRATATTAASRAPRATSGRSPLAGCSSGSRSRSRLAAALARHLPDQRPDPGGRLDETERALSSKGSLFSGSNILVLGSDVRTGDSIDESQSGPGRSDTIMLVHAAFGSVRKLSIPRDVEVDIPGHGVNKINAAYAFGGPALTIETVESFLGHGLEVNHVVEVDFEEFPDFIDALGGVTVNNKTRICSPPFDNFWKGLHFRKGEIHLNGRRALGYARVRKNSCAPGEDDRDRAARQQQVLAAIGSQVKSPSTFVRLPWVSWNAPRTLKTRHERLPAHDAVRRHGHRQLGRHRGARGDLLQRQQPVRLRGLEAGRGAEAARGRLARLVGTRALRGRLELEPFESSIRNPRILEPESDFVRVRGRRPPTSPRTAAPVFFLP